MESRLFGKIVLRLLAVYLIARGIMYLPNITLMPAGRILAGSYIFNPLLFAIPIVSPLVAGIILWAVAPLVAGWMVWGSSESLQISSVSKADIQSIAIATAGLIVSVLAIPHIVEWFAREFYTPRFMNFSWRYALDQWAFFIASVWQLVLGLLLIVGARFWVRLLRRAREFGLEKPR